MQLKEFEEGMLKITFYSDSAQVYAWHLLQFLEIFWHLLAFASK